MIINSVSLSAGGNEVYLFSADGNKYTISAADARRLNLYDAAEKPELLPLEADDEPVEFMNSKLACVKYAQYILGFGDKSRKALTEKLALKGYDRDVAESAVAVLEEYGIINDELLCIRKAAAMAETKLYGPYRIMQELQKKGFKISHVYLAIDKQKDVYCDNFEKLVDKLTAKGAPKTEKELIALKNKLIRYGYSYPEVNDAIRRFES